MTEHHDSLLFEHYELLPRQQPLHPPSPDHYSYLLSKPIPNQQLITSKQCLSQLPQKPPQQYTQKHQYQLISQLNHKINYLTFTLQQKNQQCLQYLKLLSTIKSILGKPSLSNPDLIHQINYIIINQKSNQTSTQPHHLSINSKIQSLQSMLKLKQTEIRNLKTQLYQSTANNINALFDQPLNQDQSLLKQIGLIKQQLFKIKAVPNQKFTSSNEEKIHQLIKNYQQMLNSYEKNQNNFLELKKKQQQYFTYHLTTIKSQINQTINQKCTLYNNQRISQLQNKLKQVINGLNNQPQKVKQDEQNNYKFHQLINQIQNLNQRIIQRQIQVQKLKQINQQNMLKNRQYQADKIKLQSLNKLQIKLKQKDRRIQQLQNTIIQHIDSKAKQQSNTSIDSDIQKNKSIIRNLKVLNSKLKQDNQKIQNQYQIINSQNKQLKNKLNNLSHQTDYLDIVQRASKDQQSFKVIQQILTTLINSIQNQNHCKCLQKITDYLINLTQDFPQLQLMLQQLGLIGKTQTLIPIIYNGN